MWTQKLALFDKKKKKQASVDTALIAIGKWFEMRLGGLSQTTIWLNVGPSTMGNTEDVWSEDYYYVTHAL